LKTIVSVEDYKREATSGNVPIVFVGIVPTDRSELADCCFPVERARAVSFSANQKEQATDWQQLMV